MTGILLKGPFMVTTGTPITSTCLFFGRLRSAAALQTTHCGPCQEVSPRDKLINLLTSLAKASFLASSKALASSEGESVSDPRPLLKLKLERKERT